MDIGRRRGERELPHVAGHADDRVGNGRTQAQLVAEWIAGVAEAGATSQLPLKWWLHAEPRRAMRDAITGLQRFIVTPALSKHRTFTWMQQPTLADKQLAVVARDDDYFFGTLQSRVHELWARSTGTQLREVESGFRYTPSTCFDTFPFPDSPTDAQRSAIAVAARHLDTMRARWLNPPEWLREDVIEFPASIDGPWGRFVSATTRTDALSGTPSTTAHVRRRTARSRRSAQSRGPRSFRAHDGAALAPDGGIYVSNRGISPGAGQVLRFEPAAK